MGVDYDGVGGIGIKVSDEMIDKMISEGKFTEEEWDEDPESCAEELGISYVKAGNAYSGVSRFYLMVDGKNLIEVNNNSKIFISKLDSLGFPITEADLLVISDLLIW